MKSDWKRTSTILAGAGAFIVSFAMLVMSQGPPRGGFRGGPGGPGGPDGLGPLGRDLNLSDDQKAQIKKIQDSFAASTRELRDQMRAQHESEPDPFSGNFDEAAARTAAEARAKVQVELEVAHAKMMSQIGAVLTPDQKAQLAAKRERFGRRPPPPPPGQGEDQPEQDR